MDIDTSKEVVVRIFSNPFVNKSIRSKVGLVLMRFACWIGGVEPDYRWPKAK